MGSRGTAGLVHAVLDRDKNGAADEVIPIARGLNFPNGVALRDGALYVAEINRILRYDGIEGSFRTTKRAPSIASRTNPAAEARAYGSCVQAGSSSVLTVGTGAPSCVKQMRPLQSAAKLRTPVMLGVDGKP